MVSPKIPTQTHTKNFAKNRKTKPKKKTKFVSNLPYILVAVNVNFVKLRWKYARLILVGNVRDDLKGNKTRQD